MDGRRLLYHSESDSYIETQSQHEAKEIYESSYDGGLCIDVTGDQDHELRFRKQS